MNRHERMYRALLVAYPAEYRDAYGEPMVQLLRDRLSDESGGGRSVRLWGHIGWDLARSALSERTETTMANFKTGWWRWSAGFIALAMAFVGIGNGTTDDGGPLYGRVLGAIAASIAALVIVAGLATRRRNPRLGSMMVAFGVLPGIGLLAFFWFPPVGAIGVLAMFTVVAAFNDASRQGRVRSEPESEAGAA